MKILIDPALAVFIKDLSDEQCAELLRCIFDYPNKDCDLGVWEYMKKQIQADEQKYIDKCQRVAYMRQRRQKIRASLKSNLKSEFISPVEEEEKGNKNKTKINIIKGSERGNVPKTVENSVNNLLEFFVDENFKFENVVERNKKFQDYLDLFPASVIERAELTLKKKRKGQWVTMLQILDWLEKQKIFYNINQKA